MFTIKLFPAWVSWLGIVAAVIYFLAQADLFATVIPGFPVWHMAGFIGSTLWLVWLVVMGVAFLRSKKNMAAAWHPPIPERPC